MNCKKCKKEIPLESVYCMWCGVAQKRDKKKAMYQRPDGLFEKVIIINDKRVAFRAKSEPEVYRKIAAYEEKQAAGRTFEEVAEEWKEQHFKTISPTTASGYNAPFERAVSHFGEKPIKAITPYEIKCFVDLFAAKGRAKKTVANQVLVLNLIFKYAGLTDGLISNPAEFVKIPKGLEHTPRELPSDNDLQRVINSVDLPFGLFAYFLYYTGCRKGEALALQYKDIDREKGVIYISKSLYYTTNKPNVKLPKTKAGLREIPLLDVLAKKLPTGKPSDYIFGGTEPLHGSHFNRLWYSYVEQTGISCTAHQLRHAYATLLYDAGVERKEMQDLMGHADIHTTENIYTHVSNLNRTITTKKINDFTKNTQEVG